VSKSPYVILRRPLITERALLAQEQNKYTFEVALDANKAEIRGAVEKAFGVNVLSVNTVKTRGKRVFRPRTGEGKKRDVKKAIITLAEGQKLELS
jgi:large subunit ribosomal protein L23